MTEGGPRPVPPDGGPGREGPEPTSSWLGRVFGLALGWGLVALGIVGLFVPVLQGILLIAAGLLVLSRHSPLAHRVLQALRRRFPKVDEWARRKRGRGGAGEQGSRGEEEQGSGPED